MHRQPFTTNFAALTVIVSAATGLVDIWRPPCMKSSYEGSAFQPAIPTLNPEKMSGRRTQDRTVPASVPEVIDLTFV